MKIASLQVLLASVSIFVTFISSSCKKSGFESSVDQSSITENPISQQSLSDYPCVDIFNYSPGLYPWAVSYPCPANQFEDQVNKQDIKRQQRIDSIIKANSWKYKEEIFKIGSWSTCGQTPPDPIGYLPLYGTSAVNNNIDVLLAAFTGGGSATFTVSVLQNGILGGGVFLTLQQGTTVKTFGFYPTGSMYSYSIPTCGGFGRYNGATVPGEIRNNADIPYSVSISKVITAFQFQNLKMYLRNNSSSSFYNYNVSAFNEVHYALGALNIVGITTTYQYIQGANNFQYADTPYKLGQNIKTMQTIPVNTTIDLAGGITPGVSDITE